MEGETGKMIWAQVPNEATKHDSASGGRSEKQEREVGSDQRITLDGESAGG